MCSATFVASAVSVLLRAAVAATLQPTRHGATATRMATEMPITSARLRLFVRFASGEDWWARGTPTYDQRTTCRVSRASERPLLLSSELQRDAVVVACSVRVAVAASIQCARAPQRLQ